MPPIFSILEVQKNFFDFVVDSFWNADILVLLENIGISFAVAGFNATSHFFCTYLEFKQFLTFVNSENL